MKEEKSNTTTKLNKILKKYCLSRILYLQVKQDFLVFFRNVKNGLQIFLGYDFFISYAQEDGKDYASRLQRALTDRDFVVFRDVNELNGGEKLSFVISLSLKRTRRLVVVCTRGTISSTWVADEINAFADRKQAIIPIDVENIRTEQGWLDPKDVLFISEPDGKNGPNDFVVDQISKGMYRDRVARTGRRIISGVIIVGCILFLSTTLAALGFGWQWIRAEQEATTAQLNRIAQYIETGQNLVATEPNGWESFAEASKVCRAIELNSFPVAVAAFVAHHGTRDFRKGGTGRQPAFRIPFTQASFGVPLRAVVWDGNKTILVQTIYGEILKWKIDCQAPVASITKSIDRLNNIGRLELSQNGKPLYVKRTGLFCGFTNEARTLLKGNVTDFSGTMVIVDSQLRIDNKIVKFESPKRVAQLESVWAVANQHGKVLVFNEETKESNEFEFGVPVLALDLHPQAVAIAGGGGRLEVQTFFGIEQILGGHLGPVSCVKFDPDLTGLLLSAGDDGTARLWNWELGEETVRLVGPRVSITSATFSQNGCRVATADIEGTVRIWDVDPGYRCVLDNSSSLNDWKINEKVLVGWKGKNVRTWDTATGDLIFDAVAPDIVLDAHITKQELVILTLSRKRYKLMKDKELDLTGRKKLRWIESDIEKHSINNQSVESIVSGWELIQSGEKIEIKHELVGTVYSKTIPNLGKLTVIPETLNLIEDYNNQLVLWTLDDVISRVDLLNSSKILNEN